MATKLEIWRKKFAELYRLPTPSELGMSDCDALGSRKCTPFQPGPTWEDWEEICKKRFPIRYFLNQVLIRNFQIQIKILENRIYKYKSIYYHREHLIDLRGVDPLAHYSYGYLLPGDVIRLAAWKSLVDYIEKTKPRNPETDCNFNDEDKKEKWYKDMLHAYNEAHALYKYWTIDRIAEDKSIDDLFDLQKLAVKNNDEKEYRALNGAIVLARRQFEKTEERMLLRLVKISNELVD